MITEAFVSLFLVWFIWWAITTYMRRRNLPKGPFPFPFLENLPQIALADPVNPFNTLAEKYGDIFTVTLPTGDAVILNTATLVREARLAGKQEDLAGRLPESLYPFDVVIGTDLVLSDYTPIYRFRKRVFVSAMHVFGAGVEAASERSRYAVEIAIEEIEKDQGKPFSPRNVFERSISVQLWEWISSKKVPFNDPHVENMSEFLDLLTQQSFVSVFYQLFPFIMYLPTRFSRNMKRAMQIRKEIFPPEYQAHQESYVPGTVRDLTDSFIAAYDKEIGKEGKKVDASKDDIPGLMLDVVFAGTETTATSLSWLFLYIILHPDVQQKIHEELDLVVGRDRLPSWKDAQNLPYLQATLCEVQRASALVSVQGSNAIRDTTIAGYHIPKGTFVGLNFPKVHHDEREWPEPKKFKPERFLDSEGKFVGWNKVHGFLPFSIGQRECPGQSLAKVMMFSFTSVLLQRYKIELPEGAKMPTTKVSALRGSNQPNEYLVVAKQRE